MTGYHVTTVRKLAQYEATGCILPPVRFWPSWYTAHRWAKRTGRTVILEIPFTQSYPLPDHRPAQWTPEVVRTWERKEVTSDAPRDSAVS